ncbi:four helix bundle protein [Flavobacteriaceae bacterium S356]|uniref:Four helix bundle protein n=1 Tax=Asprobacillus argus TaxID=3076534 RepID=A0ABU3LBU9_9FLAO|nr:four helix bundle protein [Flavobacteriaceae bacterium S356]
MIFSKSEKYQNNPILKETFEFSLLIIKYSESLEEKRKYVLAKQIIRSGTSIGANVKEADETEYWLFLCENLDSYPNPNQLIDKLNIIIKILNKIISSSKRN